MNKEILIGLFYNASFLLAISIIYNSIFLKYKKDNAINNIVIGIIIGFAGILLMNIPVTIAPGVFFDTRSILVSVTAMFFGFIPGAVAVIIIVIYRIIIGGSGVIMGILVTLSTFGVGFLWNKIRFKHLLSGKKNKLLEFYFVGLITHLVMLMCFIFLPQKISADVFGQIALPVLLIYPVVSLLLSTVLFYGYMNNQTSIELKESEAKYKELYNENQNRETLLKVLTNSVPDLIFVKNAHGVYVTCNSAFEKFAGKEEGEIIGLTDFDLFDKKMATLFRNMDKEMLKQGIPRRNDESVTYPDGSEVYLETLKTPYSNSKGEVLGLIGISRDITERKEREKENVFLAFHDILTGLYNRRFFEEERKRLDTKRQLPYSIIVGDINGLKLTNDAFGHEEGDKLIVTISEILKSYCRTEDILARIGGDEFSILLPQTDEQKTKLIVERIKEKCEDYSNEIKKDVYYASISLGYATKLKIEESFEKVFRNAEELMYKNKLIEHKSVHNSIINSLKASMLKNNNIPATHSRRLSVISTKFGEILKLNKKETLELDLLATLHDIGMLSLSDDIIFKKGKLSEKEWVEIRKHPEVGYNIANSSQDIKDIAEFILCHHERWDGKGYPRGLEGKNIPYIARVFSILDAFDVMTDDRPYKKAKPIEVAFDVIANNAGTQFDPDLAKLFVDNMK